MLTTRSIEKRKKLEKNTSKEIESTGDILKYDNSRFSPLT
jgi:hypothetical protein